MTFHEKVSTLDRDAEQMEQLYHTAIKAGEGEAFKKAIDDSYAAAPENLLYAAWFHRLKQTVARAKAYVTAWGWAIPLAAINALLFWWLADDRYVIATQGFRWAAPREFIPSLFVLAAPLAALFVLVYIAGAGRKRWLPSATIGISALAAGGYVLLTYRQTGSEPFQEQYLTLMTMHLPLLAWAGVGAILGAEHRDPTNRFCFLIKSLEVFVLGGLFVAAGGLFTGITIGLFDALNVDIPEVVQRLLIAGGAGVIAIIAPAVIYDPTRPPAAQAFEQGLSKLVALLMRILLPLTLLVLLVYLAFIPFNFRAPFENRDVLIVYNGMLFAVVALLVGATPVSLGDVSPRTAAWLRRGIVAVAILALIVSLYALSAILYRTVLDRLTPNRLAFIGWNVINAGLLCLVILFQARAKAGQWLGGLYRAYSMATVAYAAWTLALVLAIPWLFGINQGEIEALPEKVQEIVYEVPAPILLHCATSPHIYLLDRGTKRWIKDIETFDARGYLWRDVHSITCDDLRAIPDGAPIPRNAGPPPQP